VLGAAYKPDIDDLRESPSLDVIGLLQAKGAFVEYHDPFIPKLKHETINLVCVPDMMAAIEAADCVVIVTNHTQYNYPSIVEKSKIVVDSRNATGKLGKNNPKVVKL